jgi:hypothetical protein
MTRKPKRPRCYGCSDKSARRLNLPGSYGEVAVYCSLRCAAKEAIVSVLAGAVAWCDECRMWFDTAGNCQCEKEAEEDE